MKIMQISTYDRHNKTVTKLALFDSKTTNQSGRKDILNKMKKLPKQVYGQIISVYGNCLLSFSSKARIMSRYFAALMKSSSLTDFSMFFLAS